jgi:hypothetical protein
MPVAIRPAVGVVGPTAIRRIRRNGLACSHLNHSAVVQSSSTPAEFYGNLCFVAIAGRPAVYRKDLARTVKAIQFDTIEHAHVSHRSRCQVRTTGVCATNHPLKRKHHGNHRNASDPVVVKIRMRLRIHTHFNTDSRR